MATHPLVPLRLFRVRSVTGANLVMFCFGVGMFAMWFFLSLYLQQVLGYSPVVTGLTFLPQTLAIATGATLSGRIAPRLGPRNVLMIGAGLAVGRPLLAVVHPGRRHATGPVPAAAASWPPSAWASPSRRSPCSPPAASPTRRPDSPRASSTAAARSVRRWAWPH